MRRTFLLVIFLLLHGNLLFSAADDSQIPVVKLMEAKYAKANSLQAHFLERYFENGALVRAESGVAYFRKPGKMRWEYVQPEKNLFLVDGKNAWFYTPVDHTATKIPARQSDDLRTPLALLTNGGKLSKVCDRVIPAKLPATSEINGISTAGSAFECILKRDAAKISPESDREPPSRLFLEISDSGDLSRVVVQSAGSVLTEFSFKDWEYNPSLAEALFRFVPPPAVVIVDGLLPTSPGVRQ